MKVITWAPGSNHEYDTLFSDLRELHYQDQSHRLWKNYSGESFSYAGIVACTIYFDDNNVPELCSSISNRECWPSSAYRILNRMWKPNNKKSFLKRVSDCVGQSVISQIAWLDKHTDYQLCFASRQTGHWNTWTLNSFKNDFNLSFKKDQYKYLTCPNECENTCWQNIIYRGNDQILDQWKRQQ